MRLTSVMLLALVACNNDGKDSNGAGDTGKPTGAVDVDGDGYAADVDCNDENSEINPGMQEICDGVDQDCDDSIDDDAADATTWYADNDSDTYGGDTSLAACDQPAGYVSASGDCNDTDAAIFPGATEVCDDTDNDCDGSIDEDATDPKTWYADADGDTYGDAATTTSACSQPTGYVADALDCDDTNASVYPGAAELCDGLDNDCDTTIDEDATDLKTWYADADADSYGDPATTASACSQPEGYVADAADCDDTNSSVNPAAVELCDGLDNNCDGSIDEGMSTTWYADSDADAYGDPATATSSCTQPEGYVADATDCDDTNSSVNPGAAELCDSLDNDCDGNIDEDLDTIWYADADSDAYGDDAVTTTACAQPAGYVALGGDCNDADAAYNPGVVESDCTDPNDYNCDGSVGYSDNDGDGFAACEECDDNNSAIYPGADEVCDGLDNNCDGTIDTDAIDMGTWYLDADNDAYGSETSVTACDAPTGYVGNDEDCDDADSTINPAAAEVCDEIDNDCDGGIDEDSTFSEWYVDDDGDGYGDPSASLSSCSEVSGFVLNGDDCDDTEATINPAATEVCDGLDNDCDGSTDEEGAAVNWYADADGDGYGDPSDFVSSCGEVSGYVLTGDDCDDTNLAINPGADELCDGLDNNCDGVIDTDAVDATTWYQDADADSYGNFYVSITDCTQPDGYVANATDCDDTDATVGAGATAWYLDADEDGFGDNDTLVYECEQPEGYISIGDDCNDAISFVNPDASELCDGIDDDCDGVVDEVGAVNGLDWYYDADGDNYGDPDMLLVACTRPLDYVSNSTDCDDTTAAINPGADEYCNGYDDNCDEYVDESDAADASVWYLDNDGDGYGNAAASDTDCVPMDGYVADSTDCDDTLAHINPGAAEDCDDFDNNCDGAIDEDGASNPNYWYYDADGDYFGDPSTYYQSCDAPTGYVGNPDDCDDTDNSSYPGNTETCNFKDDNCDGTVDEGNAASSWYQDPDGDGYGSGTVIETCSPPTGYVDVDGDCDETNSAINPGAPEFCNSVDEDCNGTVDDVPIDGSNWYADADVDGYGQATTMQVACSQPSGFVSNNTDCDDGDQDINPGEIEVCDGDDNDCDGDIDEGVSGGSTWYTDDDGDGYGVEDSAITTCADPGDGYAAEAGDCDDTDPDTNPGEEEVCGDGADNNCDVSDDADCFWSGAELISDRDAVISGGAIRDNLGMTGTAMGVGDLDMDGYDDVVIGGSGSDGGAADGGRGYVYYGPLSSTDALATADATISGSAGAGLGSAVAGGDMDDDGYADLALGASAYDNGSATDAGAIYLFAGGSRWSGDNAASGASAQITSTTSSLALGGVLSSGGDVDGDGGADLLIGLAAYDGSSTDGGAIALFYGGWTGSADVSTADVWINGAATGDGLGQSVALAGDVDGDGFDDLLAGATGYDYGGTASTGGAFLFYDPTSGSAADADWVLYGASGEQLGDAVAGVGDTDGDGYDDLLIAASGRDFGMAGDAGAVYLVTGGTSLMGNTAASSVATSLYTGTANDRFGRSVSGAGDVDGDGYADLLMGATGYNNTLTDTGVSVLLYGPVSAGNRTLTDLGSDEAAIFYGESGGLEAGWLSASAGDTNADGYADFLIGSPRGNPAYYYAGSVWLYLGKSY